MQESMASGVVAVLRQSIIPFDTRRPTQSLSSDFICALSSA